MKKLVALALSAVMMATMMTGCGNKAADQTAEDTSLTYVQDKGTLILGLDDAFPPMGFRDEDQQIVGFDIDVATEVAKRMGVELELQPVDWDAKEQELATKNIDCIWNGLTITEERQQNMTMSKSYMKNTQVVVVPADSEIAAVDDLAGKKVIIQSGSTAADAIEANQELKDSFDELIMVDDNVQAMLDLKVGGSDAVVMDEVVARYYTSLPEQEGQFRVLDESLADEEYGVAFRKGDEALANEVNAQLQAMSEDGTMAEISTKWFGQDIVELGE
jgi:polar amino acid transport system substrate-binding protein